MPKYSDELKDSLLARMLSGEDINIPELSRETEFMKTHCENGKTHVFKQTVA